MHTDLIEMINKPNRSLGLLQIFDKKLVMYLYSPFLSLLSEAIPINVWSSNSHTVYSGRRFMHERGSSGYIKHHQRHLYYARHHNLITVNLWREVYLLSTFLFLFLLIKKRGQFSSSSFR